MKQIKRSVWFWNIILVLLIASIGFIFGWKLFFIVYIVFSLIGTFFMMIDNHNFIDRINLWVYLSIFTIIALLVAGLMVGLEIIFEKVFKKFNNWLDNI